jgi:amino acid permease
VTLFALSIFIILGCPAQHSIIALQGNLTLRQNTNKAGRITTRSSMTLKRKLGLSTVLAVVMGDMIGSGIFFTPEVLATVATSEWQVYFFRALCGFIVLCGALTLAGLSALIPMAGVSYHALTEAYGPFAGFMQAWMMVLVSGPGYLARESAEKKGASLSAGIIQHLGAN